MDVDLIWDALLFVANDRKERLGTGNAILSAADPIEAWDPRAEPAREFLDRNRAYWEEFFRPVAGEFDGHMLIDVSTESIQELHKRCVFGLHLAKARMLEPVFLVNHVDEKHVAIVHSYYPGDVLSTRTAQLDNATFATTVLEFLRQYRDLDTVDDLLELSFEDIQVGDLVYNTAMNQTGKGTFDSLCGPLYRRLFTASLFYERARTIFEAYDVEAAHLHHIWYIKGGVYARLALANDADVYVGDYEKCKLYDDYAERDADRNRPSQELFDHVYEANRSEALQMAEKIMEDRFGVAPGSVSANAEVDGGESTLADDVQLSRSKPTALVMAQIFVEHLRYYDHMLFRDFLTWYRETIRFGDATDDVDWLIKPHPNREKFDMATDTVSEARAIVDDFSESPVSVVPDDVSHSALLEEIDVVVTMDGTGGLEYACYGIPCIVASKSPYTGFGFSHEPETREAYFERLDSIDDLSRLDPEQVERAKVVCYLYFDLIRNVPSFSNQGPDYPQNGGSEWDRAAEFRRRMEGHDLLAKVQEYVVAGKEHYVDPDRL